MSSHGLRKNLTRIKLRNAPNKTGVYFFFDKKGKALYVGKAIDIKNRLRSHFANTDTVNPAKAMLLKETHDLKWELCDSEPEALIREAELIKKLKPRYNVLLRDDKNYFYVGMTKEPFPKLFLTHQTKGIGYRVEGLENAGILKPAPLHPKPYTPNSLFIGPFTDGNSLKRTLKILRRIFPYCTCKTPHKRECLAATLGRCIAVCCLKPQTAMRGYGLRITELRRAYRKNIKSLEDILRGKKQRLTAVLKTDMQHAAKEHRFEDAAHTRDQIQALEKIFSHCTVVANGEFLGERKKALRILQKLLKLPQIPHRIEMYDLSNIQGKFAVGSMVVFADGIPDKSQYRRFKIKAVKSIDDTAMIREVLTRRLRHEEWPLPDVLIVDGGKGQTGAAAAAVKSVKLKVESLPILGLAKGKDELHIMKLETWSMQHDMRSGENNVSSFKLQVSRALPRSRLPRPLRHLFNHMQDEAHRFAINYHKTLRSKEYQ